MSELIKELTNQPYLFLENNMEITKVLEVINRGLKEVLLESDRQTGKTTAILYAIDNLPNKEILLVVSTSHQLGLLEPVISRYNNVRLVTARVIRERRLVGCIFDIIIVDDYWFSANFINEKRFYQFFDGITHIKSYNKDIQYIKVT